MSYEYHLFVSYRRELLWTPWTRDHFKRLLTSYLQQELREAPRIFVDERIEIGADYVNTLAEGLAKSRALVAIFSGDYFSSPWCLHELDLMLDRSGGRPRSIFPVVVHDCENLPAPIDRIQSANFKEFRTTHLCETGRMYEGFSSAVGALAPQLAGVIRTAPAFRNAWVSTCITRLNAVYSALKTGSSVSPSHFVPPPGLSLLSLPRLTP
jgi:TIR domain